MWDDEYTKAVNAFLEDSEWIGIIEMPLAVQLRALARTLDLMMESEGQVQSAAASQFAQTWARLAKRTPAGGDGDGLDALLEPIPGLEHGLAHGTGCQCPDCAA